ncbi:hypothetical protein I6F50_01015 [Pseudoalteromonas sp. NZS127_1]|jgi:hypothetical protein|uniref:Transporter n=1 Tax=Pseudoalteromonas arctica TaxID=394751 RepID=A0ABU9TLQ2_9GAMM|nr:MULTISPECIES: hypothetical protein [unclassified Pseudoalteromonas]MBG9990271.1 hypothetical protein [Pseudoalteromonas sp. NZS37]MBG9993631.1 hypothetical protein [Pseudoalteromonas sp. NZS127_1]MBH0000289.1 hypothetical protein [Pseudoalteromonas sp. NSLLW24]MBH0001889.1 hypothetical protein [Pseudoalteromonas sp. SWYJZ12]MBH0012767.1 hypothetical protein [Pseudoalteromonas sp. NZS100_1]
MRTFICAVHFVCAQWMKKLDSRNKNTAINAAALLAMISTVYSFLLAMTFDIHYLDKIISTFKQNPLLIGALFYAIVIGIVFLILGDFNGYRSRVRSCINKGSFKKYILGIKLWMFGLIPMTGIMLIVRLN